MAYNHLRVTKDYNGRFMSFAQQALQMIREDEEERKLKCRQASRELGRLMGRDDPNLSEAEFFARWEAFWNTVPDDAEYGQINEIIQRKITEMTAVSVGG